MLHSDREPKRGKLGAFRQSWRPASPRDLLAGLIESHPDMEERALFDVFFEEARKHERLTFPIYEYWFTNNFRSYKRSSGPPDPEAARRRAEEIAKLREEVGAAIKRKARVMLMDMMMPNGKRLRACTGSDCLKLSKSMGRWLSALAREVKGSQKVGEALSEDRLHELYEAASS